jgi:ESF2/ABP1 family protein
MSTDRNDHIEERLIIDDKYMDESNDILEDNRDYKEKIRRTGVIYLSHIPEGMNVNLLKEKLSNYNPKRIYLVPDATSRKGDKRQNYKEGWVEFEDKMLAKLCEYELNGQMIGGKKRNNNVREEIWTIKYLHKFKWNHLMERINYSKKMREQKMKAEIAQTRRETNFIIDKYEQSKTISELKRKRVRLVINLGKKVRR